jgi:hypothetical protein
MVTATVNPQNSLALAVSGGGGPGGPEGELKKATPDGGGIVGRRDQRLTHERDLWHISIIGRGFLSLILPRQRLSGKEGKSGTTLFIALPPTRNDPQRRRFYG